jgi:enterochelin esterase-like enzyme
MAQVATQAPAVVPGAPVTRIETITVHSRALEGSLEGDSADREVIVVLPPGYDRSPYRRYPVVYALHGYSIGARQWTGEIHVPQVIETAYARHAREMIFVFPDSKTVHNGSMYSNSVTTGASRPSSHRTSWPISTRITAAFATAAAVVWWAIRWADMAPAASG